MPREIRVVSDLPRTVQDAIAAGNEVRGAHEELQNQSVAALARLDAIVSSGAQYTPDQVRDAVVGHRACRAPRQPRAAGHVMGLDDAGAIGMIGVALVYLARTIRHDVTRWRQRANGGSAHERTVSLLEGIDRHLSEHRAEMARYQTTIASLLGEIKGRLSR